MSVYNGGSFLHEAINSILNQTFEDFEFIIINDGSQDDTQSILGSYKDSRIRIINQVNIGLTASLNNAIKLANGEYIARMDADDISLPERLAKQVQWLDQRDDYCAITSKVLCIDQKGQPLKSWSADQSATTAGEIRKTLPRVNCIAHPSVMIRNAILQKYQYSPIQKCSQDYDLWLRLHADGLKIGKIDQELVKLRIHSNSITAMTVQNLGALKSIRIKNNYLKNRIFVDKRITLYDWRICAELLREWFNHYLLRKS